MLFIQPDQGHLWLCRSQTLRWPTYWRCYKTWIVLQSLPQNNKKARLLLLQQALVRSWDLSHLCRGTELWRNIQHNLLWVLPLLLLHCNRPERVICFYDGSDAMHANRKIFPFARAHGQNPNTKNDKRPLSFKSSLSQICSAAVFGIYDAWPATPWASAMGHYERQRNELKGPLVQANMCLWGSSCLHYR